jgi:phosphoribosyl 1,2-cyclic phosphodiesterase
MSLFITSLNSGSNGNCYYIGNENEAVLVDAGISCTEIELRMKRLGLSMEKVKAVFLSHEHSDHVLGIPKLVKKYQLPLYVTLETYIAARIHLPHKLVITFSPHKAVQVGNLYVTAFPKWHDAVDPHSFIVEGAGVTVGVFTDIGKPCDHVKTYFSKCHAVFLETNYDEEKLEKGSYPYVLKNRIRGDHGHLSNRQALELFIEHHPSFLSHVLLSHLSRENNHPEIAGSLFYEHAGNVAVVVASRDKETQVYHIEPNHITSFIKPLLKKVPKHSQVQLRLF